jgi:cell wall-associated NlpC family hydrolase
MTNAARLAVVAEARRWLATPYHHAADVLGSGVDCAMLLVRVFVDLGLTPPFDPRPYTKDWMLHRDDERYLGFVTEHGSIVAHPEAGDVILFHVGRCYAHGGIVTKFNPLTIIHAYAPARCVVEDEVKRNAQLATKLARAKFFSVL